MAKPGRVTSGSEEGQDTISELVPVSSSLEFRRSEPILTEPGRIWLLSDLTAQSDAHPPLRAFLGSSRGFRGPYRYFTGARAARSACEVPIPLRSWTRLRHEIFFPPSS